MATCCCLTSSNGILSSADYIKMQHDMGDSGSPTPPDDPRAHGIRPTLLVSLTPCLQIITGLSD